MQLPKELIIVTPFSKKVALILFIVLPILAFYLGTQYAKQMQVSKELEYEYKSPAINKISVNAPVSPTLAPLLSEVSLPEMVIITVDEENVTAEYNNQSRFMHVDYLSPDQNSLLFFEFLTSDGTNENCIYGIYKKNGSAYHLTSNIGTNSIGCSHGMGYESLSTFFNWIDNSTLIIEETAGKIDKFDVTTSIKEHVFQYDTNKYNLELVNNTMDRWLLSRKATETSQSYVIVDKAHNIVFDKLTFTSNDDEHVLYEGYDQKNNGIIFLIRKYDVPADTTHGIFQFLPLDSLQLRTVYTTKPTATRHMGCSGITNLESSPGSIRIHAGCLTVGKSDLDSEGFVNIKLN